MDILLTNDDGIHAAGLWVLHRAFADRYTVGVVAPDRERSAVGHAITLNDPLRTRQITFNGGRSGVAVTGTPADCVKLGLLEIFNQPPRMVISGINPGANVGVNVNYSGTVGAAREAALFGVNALSISVDSRHPQYLEETAHFVKRLAQRIFIHGMAEGTFLNVNAPDLPWAKVAGVRVVRHGVRFNGEYFEKRVDPRDRSYYWQGRDMQTRNGTVRPVGSDSGCEDIDAVYLSHGYITLTPVKCDTTDYDALERMQHWDFSPAHENQPAK